MNVKAKLLEPSKIELPEFATYIVKEVMRSLWFIILLDPNIEFIGPFENRKQANDWIIKKGLV